MSALAAAWSEERLTTVGRVALRAGTAEPVGAVNMPSAKTPQVGAVADANTGRALPDANEVDM